MRVDSARNTGYFSLQTMHEVRKAVLLPQGGQRLRLMNIDRYLLSYCFQTMQKKIEAGEEIINLVTPEQFFAWRVYMFDRISVEPYNREAGILDGIEEAVRYNKFVQETGLTPQEAIRRFREEEEEEERNETK